MKQRDNQKSRVYAGERILQQEKSVLKPMSISECQKYVNRVLARKAVAKLYGKRGYICVYRGAGGGKAYVENGYRYIRLGIWARQPVVILHEIAHHICGMNYGHDPYFVSIMLKLVRQVLGKEAHEKLLASYALHGVRVAGKNGKIQKARCPQSQKEWLQREKIKQKESKQKMEEILRDAQA